MKHMNLEHRETIEIMLKEQKDKSISPRVAKVCFQAVFLLGIILLAVVVRFLSNDISRQTNEKQLYQFNLAVPPSLRQTDYADVVSIADYPSMYFNADDYAIMWRFADTYNIDKFHIRNLVTGGDSRRLKTFPDSLKQIDSYIKQNDISSEDAQNAINYILSQQAGDMPQQFAYLVG